MGNRAPERWWYVRRAQNRKPATYRCPLCHRHLPALSEHMLVIPEGDTSRRRHAHTACVMAARKAGRMPTREEWLATQPRPKGRVRALIERIARARDRARGNRHWHGRPRGRDDRDSDPRR